MSLEKMESLESKIRKAVEVIAELKEKNSELEKKVGDLKNELSSSQENMSLLKAEKEKVNEVIDENRKLIEERDTIKAKIENMISSLDQIDMA